MGCTRLLRSELPQALTTIGSHAFDGCVDLGGKLTFPSNITSIGDYAYASNGTISEIEMQGSTPPTIHAHTFSAVDSMVTVSVPCGAVLNYYTTNHWENFPNIVEAPPFRVTAESNSEAMGTASVTQQPTCSNHTAYLQATAKTGFHFIEWQDGNTANPRQVSLTRDSVFTAHFVPNNSYITVHANDSTMGSVGGTGLYGYNAPVTLAATAYEGYHFLRWSDGNMQNPRYMVAVRDTQFTALFVSNVSTITVANANPEMGSVGGNGVYYYMNQVNLSATAAYGYHFAKWNDGNTLNPRTITVRQDSAFTAYFAPNTYSIVATANNTMMGSVGGGGSYTYMHEMSMTATAAYGYHFVKWHDDITDNPRTITVTRDSVFTAQFAANSYTLGVEPSDPAMGSAYGSGTYNYGTTATLTAVANYGYHFTQWSDGITDNPRTITVQNSATVTALFEINSYTISVESSNPAIGTTSGGGSYSYQTPVNIVALPNAGYHFTQWSDGNTDNPRLVNVAQNATYTAQFAINSYNIGVAAGNSTMGNTSGGGSYTHGSSATLSATPNYGYHFLQWQDGNTDNPRTVVVTDSARFTAQFERNSHLVSLMSSNLELGSVSGGGTYPYQQQVAIAATPAAHHHFVRWSDSIGDNPRTITVTRDTTVTAHFAIDTHSVGLGTDTPERGTVGGDGSFAYGTATWLSATPNYGYHFEAWSDGNTSNPRRVSVTQDTIINAIFGVNQYTATTEVNSQTMGGVTMGGTYDYLTTLTIAATPNYGYHFSHWSNGSTANPLTIALTRDTTLTAHFVINQYTILVQSADAALGSVGGAGSYDYMSTVSIGATAVEHAHFVQWSDGSTSNPRPVLLTRDTSFTAIFAPDERYSVSVVANDPTMGSVIGGGEYWAGQQYVLTATAAAHHYFSHWSDGETSNPRVETAIASASYTAVFETEQYTISVLANDYSMGQVAGSGSYAYGSIVTIIAHPFDGYRFVRWDNGDTIATRTYLVTGEHTYTATFEAKPTDVGIDGTDGIPFTITVEGKR